MACTPRTPHCNRFSDHLIVHCVTPLHEIYFIAVLNILSLIAKLIRSFPLLCMLAIQQEWTENKAMHS